MNIQGLQHSLGIIVPSTTDVDTPLAPEVVATEVRRTAQFLTFWFGGATAISGFGNWWSSDRRKIVTENVTLILSFSGDLDETDVEVAMAYTRGLKNRLGQEAISVLINGTLQFVE